METDISIPIKNIINEIYAVDTSRKIKAVYKAKGLEGKYTGVMPFTDIKKILRIKTNGLLMKKLQR